jgi:hypothetical protein
LTPQEKVAVIISQDGRWQKAENNLTQRRYGARKNAKKNRIFSNFKLLFALP